LGGIEEAIAGGEALGLEVIPGVELSVQYKDYKDIHILGYYIRWGEGQLVNILLEFQKRRLERGKKILFRINQCLKKEGRKPLNYDSILSEAKGSLGRMHLARKLIAQGYVNDVNEAFSRYLNPCNIPKARCTAQEAISIIKGVTGLSVLAHPRLMTSNQKDLEEIVAEFKGYGLDGLEGIYPASAQWDLNFCRYLCQKYDLILTGGSDYHGDEIEDRLGIVGDDDSLNYSLVINLRQRYFDQKGCLICFENLSNQHRESLAKNIIDAYGFQLLSFFDFSPGTGTGKDWESKRLTPLLENKKILFLDASLPNGFWEFLEKQRIKTFVFCPENTPKKNDPTSCLTWIPVTKFSAHYLIHLIALAY
jgi:predicted metal-dependent phosphoesterase TrpH